MISKKIVFVIVEGPSDSEALGVILEKIFSSNTVHVHIIHGDITIRNKVDSSNIVKEITDEVKKYASSSHLKKSDFERVIYIVDMDGAYVDKNLVCYDENSKKVRYTENSIFTDKVDGILKRNETKRNNLNVLIKTKKIWTSIDV